MSLSSSGQAKTSLLNDAPDYQRMLESSPDFIIRYDSTGRIRYLDPKLLALLALPLEAMLGRLPSEVWPDGRYAELEKTAAHVQRSGIAAIVELRALDPVTGESYLKQIHVVPERNSTGEVVGTLAFGRSIAALREAETKLSHFIESLPGMAFTFRLSPDGKGSFPFISAGIETFYGLKPEAVKQDMMPIHLLAHPDDRATIEAAIAESARTMTPYRVESRVCRPGLPVRWLETFSLPELDETGGILWYGLMLDITERKHLEFEQQAHLHLLQSMDRVNRAMQDASDLERMIRDVLDVTLSLFDCDRAFLAHPRRADDTEVHVPMERTRSEYPGAGTFGKTIPMDQDMETLLRVTRDASEPVSFGQDAKYPVPNHLHAHYEVKSMLVLPLFPEAGEPWRFGLQQCAYARIWTGREAQLLQKVGQRLQNGLTSLLIHRALRDSEQKFRSLSENLPDVVVRYDRQAKVVYANHEFKRYVGEVAEVASGTTPREHHPDGAFEDYARLLDQVLSSGKTGEMEKTSTFPNGESWTALVRMMPERNERGEIVGALAIGRDITQRKRLEAEQQSHLTHLERMDKINRAMQGTPDLEPMMRNVLETVLDLFASDRAFLLYPCDPEAAEWGIPMECTQPDYPGALALGENFAMTPEAANVMQLALQSKQPLRFGAGSPYPAPTFVGQQYHIQSNLILALRPRKGKPWLFGLHQCAYARVWTNEELHLLQEIGLRLQDSLTSWLMYRDLSASEKKFRSLAENLPDNVVRYDRQGRTIYINPNLERMLGADASEMLGTTPREFHTDGSYDDYAQLLDDVLASGRENAIEKSITTPSGELRIHQIRMIPERDEHGELIGVIGIGRDITQEKRGEEVLQLAYHDTLTGLPNRRLLIDRLRHTMSASKRSRRYIAVMFIDLDNFKPLNDQHGHSIGDLLLIEAASRITGCVRDADTVARFGGDEFVVLLSDLDTESAAAIAQAARVAEKIRTTLALPYNFNLKRGANEEISLGHSCTASIGVVVAVNHEIALDDILAWSDKAMYQAKESGRDQVHFYGAGQVKPIPNE